MLKGEKEGFRWSSGTARNQEQVLFECHTMGVNWVRRGKRLFLHLSLRYYKYFLLPCGSGRLWGALSRAVSVVPGELLGSLSCFLSFL